MKKDIKRLLEAFSVRDLQTFRNIIISLRNGNNTLEDAFVEVDRRIGVQNREIVDDVNLYIQCKNCRSSMFVYEVNNQPCTMVGGDYKSQTFCNNCGESEFYTITVDEVYNERILGKRKKEGCSGCGKQPEPLGQFR